MKPLKLVMNAFGPFCKAVEVPFEEFGTSGLFLVTGDTGAGKTTIFDAISFALFGNASGDNRTSDCFRSDFATGEDKTYVDLTFLHKGRIYKITRNPMYKRNKINGNGTTEEKANATMIMPDGAVVSGNTRVTETVTELLGIDWKQYKQIAMIAQGEFLQLLNAGSTERGNIFRKVFGTQIYEDMQKRLKAMSNELKYQCEDQDKSILQFLSGILCDPESDHFHAIQEWKKKPDINQLHKVMELLNGMIDLDDTKYKEMSLKNQSLSEKIKEKAAEYSAAEGVNQSYLKLKVLRDEQEQLLHSAEEMKQKEVLIQMAKKALYTVKPLEDSYLQVKADITDLSKDIEIQLTEVRKLEEEFEHNTILLKEKETDKPRIDNLLNKISRQESELFKYDIKTSLEEEYRNVKDRSKKMEQILLQRTDKKTGLCLEQSEKQTEREMYKNSDRELMDCQNQLDKILESNNKLNQFFKEYESLHCDIETLKVYQKEYQEKEHEFNKKNRIYQDMEACFLREQAGILASALIEGDPCPVCGSTHHPSKAVPMEDAPSEQQLKKEKLKLEEAHNLMTQTSSKCQSQLTRVILWQQQLQKSALEHLPEHGEASIDSICIQLREKFQEANISYADLKQKESEIQNSIQKNLLCEKRLQEITEELIKIEELIAADKEELAAAVNQISMMEGKIATYQEELLFATKKLAEASLEKDRKEHSHLQEELLKIEKAYHNCEKNLGMTKAVLADNQIKYEKKQMQLQVVHRDWTDKLRSCGFGSTEDYKHSLLSEEELEMQTICLDTYRKNCEQTAKQMEQLLIETRDKAEKDLTAIRKEQNELDCQKELYQVKLQNLFSRWKTNLEIRDNVNEKYKEQEKLRKEYITVSELSRTANGELSGKAKIAFEQYVQAYYFNNVIKEANKRLYRMTNSQYILMRKDDAANLRSSCGLELEVMDYYTGKPRPIKSLSGGESFKAALSLALGLSDVIQNYAGGIEVDAMFIDEGFGSLDSNSLEQAIQTLNTLTMGNRFVGIISHVSELKERIDKKIMITKSIDGSRLSLVK